MSAAGKKVAILVTRGVEQPELTSPREALDAAGAITQIVSPADGSLQAMKGDWDRGEEFAVDVPLADAAAGDYDMLVLPGGTLNADALRGDPRAVEFVKAFFAAQKPVAAICHAPWLLAEAGVAHERKLTSVGSIKVDLVNAGAKWEDSEVVIDGNLITSRTPADLEAFDAAIVAALD
ncbi:DJ-1/PfpI/YhbO family deglycase/protease [Brevibacterium sp. 5221]|uniref:DJ-1/PfpI/YhbO family deglycase/protease n=1 Tax=Brevibacterium rongguiense TaxID=2695267 RepID=A0A6N9H643_9MICO|nr:MULTISPECIES: type 1 glutamine amidotransferase domain-containing protein [Brevibacterium]MYM19206.1 DJ-1/PfpI/YhbO family deglycase/protease [Brevibacterium rongguiense]WAL39208.1 type 1 glutamine amidotransferase [Brevibacterium sp. BRM-1]